MFRSQVFGLTAALSTATAWAAPAFKETFDASWASRWKKSSWKTDEGADGTFTLTAGKWYGDAEEDKGIQTGPDARFFAYYSKLDTPYDNDGKDLVVQFSVKHEQRLDCGGGYIKLIPASVSDQDMEKFSGDTQYSIMFGPDICGFSTKKVHTILNHDGDNHLINKDITCMTDDTTHVYTLVLKPDNTYEVLIDLETAESGSLEEDWSILEPRQIPDPDAKKPEEWDERPEIPDETDTKPDGWDDVPRTIADAEATKPEAWDEEDDGVWEPPQIPNPEYKGEWHPKMIENPAYKGLWSPAMIDNPEFKEDKRIYHRGPIGYVAFELWQVKAGSIFDNIILTDSKDEALEFAKATWGKNIEGEKKMKAAVEEEEQKKMEAEAEEHEEDDIFEAAASSGGASSDDAHTEL